MNEYKVGDIIKCRVTGIEDYGIFVKANNNFDGLIHISEIAHNFVQNVDNYAALNDEIFCRVIEVAEDGRMKLSIKDIDYKNTGKINRIIESPLGFKPLKEKLPEWTEEKMKELEGLKSS